jgi:hypothetical protein
MKYMDTRRDLTFRTVLDWLLTVPGVMSIDSMTHATYGGYIRVVKWIDNRCQIPAIYSPLITAITYGRTNIVKWVVENRPYDTFNFFHLKQCVSNGKLECFKWVLENAMSKMVVDEKFNWTVSGVITQISAVPAINEQKLQLFNCALESGSIDMCQYMQDIGYGYDKDVYTASNIRRNLTSIVKSGKFELLEYYMELVEKSGMKKSSMGKSTMTDHILKTFERYRRKNMKKKFMIRICFE